MLFEHSQCYIDCIYYFTSSTQSQYPQKHKHKENDSLDFQECKVPYDCKTKVLRGKDLTIKWNGRDTFNCEATSGEIFNSNLLWAAVNGISISITTCDMEVLATTDQNPALLRVVKLESTI